MLLINCPFCGSRPEIEFRHAGEAHLKRPTPSVSDETWADFVYMRANPKGLHAERWRHIHGCGRYFNAIRHTVTDRILTTYKAGEPRPGVGSEIAWLAPTSVGNDRQ
jgi:sarcosine oxidase subunit delta